MWNNGKKCAILLGFDFDAESLWTNLGMTSPTPQSRGHYGARVGVPRILDLLDKHRARATFFVPGDTARRHPEVVREIHARGHEIGHHGDLHESPANLAREEEKRVLEAGIETLEKVVGERPRGYRSPAWDLSPDSVSLFEECGFLWDSSMMGDDFTFYNLKDGDRDTNIVEIPVSWELDDAPHFFFTFSPVYLAGMASPTKVYEIWSAEFEGAYENQGAFVLTCHPQIIGRWHRLRMLDRLLGYISGHPDVWFATCSEAVTAWQDGRD